MVTADRGVWWQYGTVAQTDLAITIRSVRVKPGRLFGRLQQPNHAISPCSYTRRGELPSRPAYMTPVTPLA